MLTLPDELDRAATYLEQSARDQYRADILFYPRAVNLLRAKAASLRQPKGARPGKNRTVKAWVGKKRSKGNEIRIRADRISDTTH